MAQLYVLRRLPDGGAHKMTDTSLKKTKKWDASHYYAGADGAVSLVFLAVFAYLPMVGILFAFKDGNKSLKY